MLSEYSHANTRSHTFCISQTVLLVGRIQQTLLAGRVLYKINFVKGVIRLFRRFFENQKSHFDSDIAYIFRLFTFCWRPGQNLF